MADNAAPTSSPKKAAPKKRQPAKPANHPPYKEMIKAAIAALKERNGSSRQSIVKYITENFKVDKTQVRPHINRGLKKMVETKVLIQPKGTGASGRFKLAKPVAVPKKKTAAKKKPAAKKTSAKKTTAKKPKTKKAKKPAAGTAKKAKDSKTKKSKTKKPAAKKPAAKPKKPAAKKSASKKTKPAGKKSPAKKPTAKKASKAGKKK